MAPFSRRQTLARDIRCWRIALSLQDKVDRSLYLLHYVTISGATGDDRDLRRLGFFRSEAAPGIGNRRLRCTPRGVGLMT